MLQTCAHSKKLTINRSVLLLHLNNVAKLRGREILILAFDFFFQFKNNDHAKEIRMENSNSLNVITKNNVDYFDKLL